MELLYILTIFSLLGFISVIGYLFIEKSKEGEEDSDEGELLKERVASLEAYVFELEERLDSSSSEIRENIISMYNEGHNLFVIENRLELPRAKVEAVLSSYESKKRMGI